MRKKDFKKKKDRNVMNKIREGRKERKQKRETRIKTNRRNIYKKGKKILREKMFK